MLLFCFSRYGDHRYLHVLTHSFPTRRSSDLNADAILKGPIGLSHEESKKIPIDQQPERGALLPLRRRYNTYANFRPVYLPKALAHFSPLKPEIIGRSEEHTSELQSLMRISYAVFCLQKTNMIILSTRT